MNKSYPRPFPPTNIRGCAVRWRSPLRSGLVRSLEKEEARQREVIGLFLENRKTRAGRP
jgi:hypothetical protein